MNPDTSESWQQYPYKRRESFLPWLICTNIQIFTTHLAHTCKGLGVFVCVSCDSQQMCKYTRVSRPTSILLARTNLHMSHVNTCQLHVWHMFKSCKHLHQIWLNSHLASLAMASKFIQVRLEKCKLCRFCVVRCWPVVSWMMYTKPLFLILDPSGPKRGKVARWRLQGLRQPSLLTRSQSTPLYEGEHVRLRALPPNCNWQLLRHHDGLARFFRQYASIITCLQVLEMQCIRTPPLATGPLRQHYDTQYF